MKKYIFITLLILFALTSCKNDSWSFPDYDYSTVYFAYQYPIRTIVLGEDIYDTTLDNEHKCLIMATMGGVYNNNHNISIDVKVDNSLCDNLLFKEGGEVVKPMPTSYYTLPSDMKITIPKGKVAGGIEVQLTDEFFKDPKALTNSYVIPLQMTAVEKADSILQGYTLEENPNRHESNDWTDMPKDFILYSVKYINPWHASYLRRGIDENVGKGADAGYNKTIVRRDKYVERDEVCNMTTLSLNKVQIALKTKDKEQKNVPFNLVLTFDDNDNCVISAPEDADYSVAGEGEFVKRGDKNSWGNQDRDVVYLKYKVGFDTFDSTITDTLVVRDRGVVLETFAPWITQ